MARKDYIMKFSIYDNVGLGFKETLEVIKDLVGKEQGASVVSVDEVITA